MGTTQELTRGQAIDILRRTANVLRNGKPNVTFDLGYWGRVAGDDVYADEFRGGETLTDCNMVACVGGHLALESVGWVVPRDASWFGWWAEKIASSIVASAIGVKGEDVEGIADCEWTPEPSDLAPLTEALKVDDAEAARLLGGLFGWKTDQWPDEWQVALDSAPAEHVAADRLDAIADACEAASSK